MSFPNIILWLVGRSNGNTLLLVALTELFSVCCRCRYGASEIHPVAAFIGGKRNVENCVQEILRKSCTRHQATNNISDIGPQGAHFRPSFVVV
jgi:hypothetical protein